MVRLSLQLEWSGFSADELEGRVANRAFDLVAVPLCGYWYLAQAVAVTPREAYVEAYAAMEVPTWQSIVRAVLAAVTFYVLLVHVWFQPPPMKEEGNFEAQAKVGRWVFITRQCVVLQAWHQLFSLISPISQWLTAVTHGSALWISTLGWFLTGQFLLLVARHPEFMAVCRKWEARDIRYKSMAYTLHIPAFLVAVLDLSAAKNHTVLHTALDYKMTLTLALVFVLVYFLLIFANSRMTGEWPYRNMAEFSGSVWKWGSFGAAQFLVLLLFFGPNVLFSLWL